MTPPPLPFARPFIGPEEEEAVLRVLRSGWLTTGREALAFEEEFAAFLGAPGLRCLAVNSSSAGLCLSLAACGVGPGDKVLVPTYTFTATAEAACHLGAEPVFVDCAPGGFNIDVDAIERALAALPGGRAKAGAKALIPVHFGGLPCDMDAINAAAAKVGLRVIEDAAHAFPSLTSRGYAGTLADVGVFSFYATKPITTGEGGMIAVRDERMAQTLCRLRSQGIDRSVWNRYTDSRASWYYEVTCLGWKCNLPDLLAALGRAQLRRASALLALRRSIAARYDRAFAGDERFEVPPTGPADARHLYPLRIRQGAALSRDTLAAALQRAGIGVSVHFIPLHMMPFYKNRCGLHDEDFPEALSAYKRTLSLPIWPGMTNEQVERVTETVLNMQPGGVST
ncbi:MAG: DegT/DnrJ/EryC1/StrS family aminotransferase [Treponema sp.]|jgi:dTDP-4-amino-4,6-dideoxygalactose transaminase|nr:DegT/DnrJ/EryC1/StrS family aminotransferase [Treponema sp.]